MYRLMNRISDAHILCGFLALLCVAIAVVIACAVREDAEWSAFVAARACREVGRTAGAPGVAVNPAPGKNVSPVSVVWVPGKTGWLCNDGVTYWK